MARLKKAVYGTVQAPRAWMATFTEALVEIGFEKSSVDPCLFLLKTDEKVEALVIVYVDDAAIGGDAKVVDWIKTQIAIRFNITDLGELTKHLGVWYHKGVDEEGRYMMLSMDDFARQLIKEHEEHQGKQCRTFATPAYPSSTLEKATETDDIVNQKEYWSVVGKLLWQMK